MANSILTIDMITRKALEILENNLVTAGKVNRQFENQFNKIGNSITVRLPNKFTVTSGPGLSIQNVTEPSTSITCSRLAPTWIWSIALLIGFGKGG